MKAKAKELGIPLDGNGTASAANKYDSQTEPPQGQDLNGLIGEDLLKTIKVPANLANLSSRLPKSNYEKTRAQAQNSLTTVKRRADLTKTSQNRQAQSLNEDQRADSKLKQ